jgi:hypothetical protein
VNHDISLKDLLLVPEGPPEAVWQSALQTAFASTTQPEDEDLQPGIVPEDVVTPEGNAAGMDSETDDDLTPTGEDVAANEISGVDAESAGNADSASDPDEVSGLEGDADEGYDN